MRFDYSVAKNFRNLRPGLKVEWDPGINLILGRNGAGKTNLLETLSILTGWGAFGRTHNVISWDNNLVGAFTGAQLSGEENFTITANITQKISLRLNDKAITSTNLRLALPSIIFMSGDTNFIDGSPSSRRMFIDRLCSLLFPPYAKRLADFKYILRSRVALLRQGKSPNITTEIYCNLGGWIMERRREVLALLVSLIPAGKFTLSFLPELKISGSDFLREALTRNYAREIHAQRPQDGPGFDELAITLCENGRPASEALSRGQKRRLILYMFIMAGKLIAKKLNRAPILFFDDLTAELDKSGREFVYSELEKTKWQVFITAPEKPFATRKKFGSLMLS